MIVRKEDLCGSVEDVGAIVIRAIESFTLEEKADLWAELILEVPDAEIARQMRERGSVSSLRGYKSQNPTDLHLEICTDGVILATPVSAQGLEFLRDHVIRFRSERVLFCNALVITRSEFEHLRTAENPDGLRIRIENYI